MHSGVKSLHFEIESSYFYLEFLIDMTTFLISVLLFWGAYFGGPEGLNAAMTDTGAAYLINKGRAHWTCSLPAASLLWLRSESVWLRLSVMWQEPLSA